MLKIRTEQKKFANNSVKKKVRTYAYNIVYLYALFPTFSSSSLHYCWQISFVLLLYISLAFFEIGYYSGI